MDFNKFLFTSRQGKRAKPKASDMHFKLHGVEHKPCSKCCSPKPLTEFASDPSTSDGLHSQCKECRNSTRKQKGMK